MPRYKNRSGQVHTFGEFSFAPFEEKNIPQNVLIAPPVFLVSDEPKFMPYKHVIENGTTNSKSLPFQLFHSLFIRIDDKLPDFYEDEDDDVVNSNPDGSTLTLGLFITVGPPDKEFTYELVKLYKFTKQFGKWIIDGDGGQLLRTQQLDMYYEVAYIQIMETTASSVDVSLKYY